MTAAVTLPPSLTVIERGWLSSNNIVFDDGGAASVVDTGYASHSPQTVQLVRAALAGKRLTRIINTHMHSDHVGGNAALQAAFGASILVPSGQAQAIEQWDEEALSYTPMAQFCPRFQFDAVFEPNAQLELGGLAWQVVAAPGHDAHMVVLYNDEERILISADALWEDGFGAIFPEIEGRSGFAEERAVLEWIARTKPRIVIPGHGRPFVEVSAALDRAMGRLEALSTSPERNARHIAKVMVKFLLLELRSIPVSDLIGRLTPTRYLQALQARYFPDRTGAAVIERAVAELVAAGAVVRNGDRVENFDV